MLGLWATENLELPAQILTGRRTWLWEGRSRTLSQVFQKVFDHVGRISLTISVFFLNVYFTFQIVPKWCLIIDEWLTIWHFKNIVNIVQWGKYTYIHLMIICEGHKEKRRCGKQLLYWRVKCTHCILDSLYSNSFHHRLFAHHTASLCLHETFTQLLCANAQCWPLGMVWVLLRHWCLL